MSILRKTKWVEAGIKQHGCDFCDHTEDMSISLLAFRSIIIALEVPNKIESCCVCEKDFCDDCFMERNAGSATCEDGSLCPQCSEKYYIKLARSAVGGPFGVFRRDNDAIVEAKYL